MSHLRKATFKLCLSSTYLHGHTFCARWTLKMKEETILIPKQQFKLWFEDITQVPELLVHEIRTLVLYY